MQPRPELINPALDWLAAMDAREFKRRFKGSPLERTGRKRLLRNVAIAMGNSGDARFLPQLDAWAEGTRTDAPTNSEAPRRPGSARNCGVGAGAYSRAALRLRMARLRLLA